MRAPRLTRELFLRIWRIECVPSDALEPVVVSSRPRVAKWIRTSKVASFEAPSPGPTSDGSYGIRQRRE